MIYFVSKFAILLFFVVTVSISFSQRKFDVREIEPPPNVSDFYYISNFNVNDELVGSGRFNRCIEGGGGGDFTSLKKLYRKKIAKDSKLEVICTDELRPLKWTPTNGWSLLPLPSIDENQLYDRLGHASKINDNGQIVGEALNTEPYNGGYYGEYLTSSLWSGSFSWFPAPGPGTDYGLQVVESGINNRGQTFGARCYQGFLASNNCDYHYPKRYFFNGNWITTVNDGTWWERISNFNDNGEVIFKVYYNSASSYDLKLYSLATYTSIRNLLPNPNNTDYSFGLNDTGDIFVSDYSDRKFFWIRSPLDNPRIEYLTSDETISFGSFNDQEYFLAYKSGKYILWHKILGAIDLNLGIQDSGWTITDLISINNKNKILVKGEKNGIAKYLILTPKPPPPLIFIPGTMGSELYLKEDHSKFWVNLTGGTLPVYGTNYYMTLDSSSDYFMGNDAFSARDALRNVTLANYPATSIYNDLIENLKTYGGYKEYNIHSDNWNFPTPDEGGCDRSQINNSDPYNNPTLFIFPYDFRFDNGESADKLERFVRCVQDFYPNKPINLLGHSQGGLVSRRYIIDHPNNHGISKLITIATPFLGAPEALYKLETGGDGWEDVNTGLFTVFAITPTQMRFLAKHFKSVHQLLPSRDYYNINNEAISGLKEIGDVNGNGISDEWYSYDQLVNFLDSDFNTLPGTNGKNFHDCLPENQTRCQDDWRQDTSGVSYMHLVGQQSRDTTTNYVEVKNEVTLVPNYPYSTFYLRKIFEPIKGPGDKTVPEISASRDNRADINMNAPGARRVTFFSLDEAQDEDMEHNGLTKNKDVLSYVLFGLGLAEDPLPPQAIQKLNNLKKGIIEGKNSMPTQNESFYAKIIGVSDVEISDEAGNKTTKDGDIFINQVSGLDYSVIGDNALFLSFPTIRTHFAKFQVGNLPFNLEIVKGINNQSPNLAVRYKDISLPQGTKVQLKVTNLNQVTLHYDADNDGVYETPILPTAEVSGSIASDRTPPNVNINVNQQGNTAFITINAQDNESGIKQILYSVDGTTFQAYTNPIAVNVLNPMTILAIADNNVGIRSSLMQKNLFVPTASNSSIKGKTIGENGRGVRSIVTLTKINTSETFTTRTNSFGFYNFENLATGESYILTPSAKGYQFNPPNKIITPTEDLNDVDFIAIRNGGNQ
jgi:pimeloyl-ACP methyl ester carboxylesterase